MRTLVAAAEPPDRPDVVLVPVTFTTMPPFTAATTTGWTYEVMATTTATPSTGSLPPSGRGTLS